MINKRLINTGAEAAPAAFDPLQNFETVTYTGNGGTQKITGYIRKGAAFDGSSSYIETPSLIPVNDYSFSCWVYFDSLAAASNYRVIYEAYKNTWWYLAIFDGGKIATYNGTSTFNTTSNVISTGQWYHIVYTSSSTSGKNIYLNGNSTPVATNGDTTGNSNPSGSWEGFGKYHTTGVGSMHGKIDQVRIYNTTLSSSDVTNLYNESSVPTANLIAHYKLDGDATDEQGSYDGAATNVSWKYDGTATDVSYAYNGTPTNVSFVGTLFQPDLVWIKDRDNAFNHNLYFDNGGTIERLRSSTAGVSDTNGNLSSFDSNGFTFTGSNSNTNANGDNYVAWCWKAGGTVSANNNTEGDITSTVSANQDAGFSIVKYTGNTLTNQSIGHGLSSTPELIIIKNLDDGTADWLVAGENINYYLNLNGVDADPSSTSYNWITNRGATTFTVGSQRREQNINGQEFIAYCFHSVSGYSSIGAFVGDGSTDAVLNLGFEPRWIMIKNTSTTTGWFIMDYIRDNFAQRLRAEATSNESNVGTLTTSSTGITISATNSDGRINGRPGYSDTMLYMAFK